MTEQDTKTQLLDEAERLVRTRGYNAFSYRDLAEQVGIKTASIHYHFPSKADLGEALVERERALLAERLGQLDQREKDPKRKLLAFLQGFQANTIGCENRMCLAAMLAVEQETLPDPLVSAVRGLFSLCEGWLAKVLEEGRKKEQFAFKGSPEATARALFSTIEGALLTARAFRDVRRFETTARWALETILT